MIDRPTTAAEMRALAARFRKLAAAGHRPDRLLLQFAARLEYDAEQAEKAGEQEGSE